MKEPVSYRKKLEAIYERPDDGRRHVALKELIWEMGEAMDGAYTQLAAANAKLENCAAGPWSTDVESAPYRPDVLVCSANGVITLACRQANGMFVSVPGRWDLPHVIAWAPIHAHPAALQTKKLNEME